jgi:hydroperoxide lyase
MNPPVPLQFGRARNDFVLRSHHDAAFTVTKGDLLCGYQPLAMRDPQVFHRADEFLPDRFLGDQGQGLLHYLYWSNGPQTAQPATGNKQCAAKDAVRRRHRLHAHRPDVPTLRRLRSRRRLLHQAPQETRN